MSSNEVVRLGVAIICDHLIKELSKVKLMQRRRWWVRSWVLRRQALGASNRLLFKMFQKQRHVFFLPFENHFVVFFEPTDRRKAANLLKFKQNVSCASPNLNELRAMAKFLNPNASIEQTKDLHEVLKLGKIVSKAVDFIIVTLGKHGVVTIKPKKGSIEARLYPVRSIENVENVSGAGDCFTSGFISGILSRHKESKNVHIGIQSAKLALMSKNTVPLDLSSVKITVNEAEYETLIL